MLCAIASARYEGGVHEPRRRRSGWPCAPADRRAAPDLVIPHDGGSTPRHAASAGRPPPCRRRRRSRQQPPPRQLPPWRPLTRCRPRRPPHPRHPARRQGDADTGPTRIRRHRLPPRLSPVPPNPSRRRPPGTRIAAAWHVEVDANRNCRSPFPRRSRCWSSRPRACCAARAPADRRARVLTEPEPDAEPEPPPRCPPPAGSGPGSPAG